MATTLGIFSESGAPVPFETGMDSRNLGRVLQALYAKLPGSGHARVIQFVGPEGNEGTSTVAERFAKLAANRISGSVCLISADVRTIRHNNGTERHNIDVPTSTTAGSDPYPQDALVQVDGSRLFVARQKESGGVGLLAQEIESLLGKIRPSFALVVVDSMPLGDSTDVLLISRSVDAVVLVVEAERTTQLAAESACQMITQAGGQIIGVILNKRHYYMPGFLYRLLGQVPPNLGNAKYASIKRCVGWALLSSSALVLAYELTLFATAGIYHPLGIGELWSRLEPASLETVDALFAEHPLAAIAQQIYHGLLKLPIWALLAVPGLAFLAAVGYRR